MEDIIINYVKFTDLAIKELDKENFDELEKLLDERENIFNKIRELNNETSDLKKIMQKYNLLEKEEEFLYRLSKRKKEVKEKMNKLKKMKNSYNQYRGMSSKVSFLNRKI